MSAQPRRRRDPVRIVGWWLRWALVPALVAVWVSGNVDARSLPFFGTERISAVLLVDGQAYFGHLDDSGETGWLVLHDVYYLQDAKGAPTNVAVSLTKRGGEAHEPADGMRINRDRVLAVERVSDESPVAHAIAVERELQNAKAAPLALNPQLIADRDALATQRIAAEHGIARGFAAQADTLTKLNTELVLPVTKAEAASITDKAMTQLRGVRRDALTALGLAMGLSNSDAAAYAQRTDTQLEGQSFANEQGVLLAPDLASVVVQAAAFYAQAGDAAAQLLTQPRSASPAPSASPSPSGSPARSASPSPSPRP